MTSEAFIDLHHSTGASSKALAPLLLPSQNALREERLSGRKKPKRALNFSSRKERRHQSLCFQISLKCLKLIVLLMWESVVFLAKKASQFCFLVKSLMTPERSIPPMTKNSILLFVPWSIGVKIYSPKNLYFILTMKL